MQSLTQNSSSQKIQHDPQSPRLPLCWSARGASPERDRPAAAARARSASSKGSGSRAAALGSAQSAQVVQAGFATADIRRLRNPRHARTPGKRPAFFVLVTGSRRVARVFKGTTAAPRADSPRRSTGKVVHVLFIGGKTGKFHSNRRELLSRVLWDGDRESLS